MPNPFPPARLHIILAREAHKAVIIRRGLTEWFRLSLWHTDTDTFEHGQWLKGKVYEERCDVSPDGNLFLYFAAKHRSRYARTEDGYSRTWTAISKPPYFTALALWNIGDMWVGGGIFVDDNTVWLNREYGRHDKHKPSEKLNIIVNNNIEVGDMPIYARRLKNSGWVLQPEGKYDTVNWQIPWQSQLEWRKSTPNGLFVLALYSNVINYQREYHYTLHDHVNNKACRLSDMLWADWDHTGRLVGTRQGQILAMNPEAPNEDVTILEDVND